jgi:L-glyceraldehyde 3-phosphate reductase
VPEGSRASRAETLDPKLLTEELRSRLRALDGIAQARGQSLAQLALRWALRDARVTSALVGASSVEQLEANVAALDGPPLTDEELAELDRFAVDSGVDLWAESSAG